MSRQAQYKKLTEKFRNPNPKLDYTPNFLCDLEKVPSLLWTFFSLLTILTILDKHYMAPKLWAVNF